MCWRWRNLPKPTIARSTARRSPAAHVDLGLRHRGRGRGRALFRPRGRDGANGVEYFAHPWELGPRKAKELLFTGTG